MVEDVDDTPGNSLFGFYVNCAKALLEGAASAVNGLWVSSNVKIPIKGIAGLMGGGTPTTWFNIRRNSNGFRSRPTGNSP
ncbi:hypothetical protein Rhe02_36620 [Rhizocola hellebori]|uniref:Uncharacterized protein n=1 Tax=Rhizocola hellebori TaxID=1392758 RepID=A0A8J3Q839_9ACTN|nr:hypothetical protein Rhe02_36620 [Rhizocola hellebori]